MKRRTFDQAFINGYMECALWSSSVGPCESNGYDENDDTSFDSAGYTQDDFSDAAVEAIIAECRDFLDYCGREEIDIYSYDAERAGHDFWLTRNGHGAGFWDGDYEDGDGRALTAASKTYGDCYLYLGDDDLVHVQ